MDPSELFPAITLSASLIWERAHRTWDTSPRKHLLWHVGQHVAAAHGIMGKKAPWQWTNLLQTPWQGERQSSAARKTHPLHTHTHTPYTHKLTAQTDTHTHCIYIRTHSIHTQHTLTHTRARSSAGMTSLFTHRRAPRVASPFLPPPV